MASLLEKQLIEKATAEGFLYHYNKIFGESYAIESIAGDGEAPDAIAKDKQGNILGIEVTLTEDSPGDIASALGRSNKKSVEVLKEHLKRVKEGKETIRFNCLSENVLDVLVSRIEAKLNKRYGSNIALVIRDTSGVPWEWSQVVPLIQSRFYGRHIPFDRGIWLLSRCKGTLTNICSEDV